MKLFRTMYICLFYFLDFTYKWYLKAFVFLCLTYFTSIIFPRSILVPAKNFVLYNGQLLFHRLLQCLGYCLIVLLWTLEGMYLFKLVGFSPHALYPGMELLNYIDILFLVFENFHIVFHGGCTNLYSYKSVCLFIDHSHVMVKGLA